MQRDLASTHLARLRCALAACAAAVFALAAGGCEVGAAVGAMVESYKRTSTHEVKAEYLGLEDKSFAVVITADRVLQADKPGLLPGLTIAVSERIRANTGASGYVPPNLILAWQANTPRWRTMTHSEIASSLGVDRLIYVEVLDFRLHEPGNQYLWDGLATATMGVFERNGPFPEDFSFRKQISVGFPDKKGSTPQDIPEATVAERLQTRLVDRIVWPFYDHQEPYYPTY